MQSEESPELQQSRRYCRRIARSHYENFMVGSIFLPRPLRQHVYNIYAFARMADDFADESASPEESLRKLEEWEQFLLQSLSGHYRHPIFPALRETIETFDIPVSLFQDLLRAFRQDQTVYRYNSFDDLLGYCRYSANPVGRIYLHVYRLQNEDRFYYSDLICTGLQLANFWQDVKQDWRKGRIYIPLDDMKTFGVNPADLDRPVGSPAFRELLRFEVERTEELFRQGRTLLTLLPRQVRRDIELFVAGGEAILREIRRQNFDTLSKRPTVSNWRKAALLINNARRWFL